MKTILFVLGGPIASVFVLTGCSDNTHDGLASDTKDGSVEATGADTATSCTLPTALTFGTIGASPALPGLRARLQLADESESLTLFEIIGELGPKAAALKPTIIACASRNAVASSALATLANLRVLLSSKERRALARAYRDECARGGSMDERQPFAQVMSEAFSTGRSKRAH